LSSRSATSKERQRPISRAPLTDTANANAKFVTQTDAASYNGVSYSGFVNGENTETLNIGGLAFIRTAQPKFYVGCWLNGR
jgi:hypothetical protein